MRVNEFFYSLQGEGRLAGTPSVFIRLAGCPLRCRWCDTAYAQDPLAGTEQTAQSLLDRMVEYPTRHVVVTGGEPLVQDGLGDFLRVCSEAGAHITLETAGLQYRSNLPIHLISISPKLANSSADTPQDKRLNVDAIRQLMEAYPYQLKFVVDRPEDLNEIAECVQRLETVDPEQVYLMPQAGRREAYIEKSVWLSEYCLQTGFAFSPRLHVMLYDGQKGK